MQFPETLGPLDIAAYEHAHKVVNAWPLDSLEFESDGRMPSSRIRVPMRHLFDIVRAVVAYADTEPNAEKQQIMANHMAFVAMQRVSEHEGPNFSSQAYTQQLLGQANFIDANVFADLAPTEVRIASIRVRGAILGLFMDTIEPPAPGDLE